MASGECSRIFCLVRAPDTESAQRRVEEVQKPRVQNFDLFNVDLSVQFNPINRFLLANSSGIVCSFLGMIPEGPFNRPPWYLNCLTPY